MIPSNEWILIFTGKRYLFGYIKKQVVRIVDATNSPSSISKQHIFELRTQQQQTSD